ncbi:Transcription repressor OFP17 [Capsicum annuum]|uniref:Transcription repressor OFP17 n=1 Tax=Capsicum annuum TaxID=4072 RepID=A0A2G2XV47_CAPAN|nr:Transcription repressor OFP17 [Capsicum annuum]PHT61365.1 Transcription repressor OFP17 [Capsicum annuum]
MPYLTQPPCYDLDLRVTQLQKIGLRSVDNIIWEPISGKGRVKWVWLWYHVRDGGLRALLITVVAGPCAIERMSTTSQSICLPSPAQLLAAPDVLSILELKLRYFRRGLMLVEVMLSLLLAMQLAVLIYGRLGFRRSTHETERLRRRGKEEDQVMELKSFLEAEHHNKAPFPSLLTPAYARLSNAATRKEVPVQDDVEDACRSFENHLVEMMVEKGKMRDLADVEELLYCWKNLKSPVFIDLVCRFYGELCRDLFSNSYEDDINTPKRHL